MNSPFLSNPLQTIEDLRTLRRTITSTCREGAVAKLELAALEQEAETQVLLNEDYAHLKNAESRKAQIALLVRERGGEEFQRTITRAELEVKMLTADAEALAWQLKLHKAHCELIASGSDTEAVAS